VQFWLTLLKTVAAVFFGAFITVYLAVGNHAAARPIAIVGLSASLLLGIWVYVRGRK
jgi:hypothetical protein